MNANHADNLPAIVPAELLRASAAAIPPDRHPLAVYQASLPSEHSKRSVKDAARRALAVLLNRDRKAIDAEALRAFPWPELRYQHVQAIKARLLDSGASPSTINTTLSHVRGIVREAWRLGYISAEILARVLDVKNVKAHKLPAGRALSSGELAAIFGSCAADPAPQAARDAGLFSVLYVGGARRTEAAGLDLADYDTETGALAIRGGKGRKDRIVYIENGGADALLAWLEIRGTEPGALFHPVTKGGKIERRAMTPQAVRDVCERRARSAGVKHFTPHDLRRTFVSDLLDAGADVGSVQKLAGHADPKTTLGYDRRPEAAKRKAAALLHVPYVRRRKA